MTFDKKIQLLRKENRMSQEQLGETLHVSRQAISKWEKGIAIPDTDNVVQLSKFFQVPIEYLLFDKYDSIGQVEPIHEKKEKFPMKRKSKAFILIFVGIILEIISVISTYIIQSVSFTLYGNCYTNALNYLKEMPTVLIVILGVFFITWGIFILTKKYWQKLLEFLNS